MHESKLDTCYKAVSGPMSGTVLKQSHATAIFISIVDTNSSHIPKPFTYDMSHSAENLQLLIFMSNQQ